MALWYPLLSPHLKNIKDIANSQQAPVQPYSLLQSASGLLEPPAGQQGDHNRDNKEDDCQHIPLHQSPAFPGPL